MPEAISFKTFDGVKIVGDWYPSATTIGVAILLHMMPLDRKSWAPFQQVLAKYSIASLAIDLRGHGESVVMDGTDTKLDYKKFTDDQHVQYINDVSAALDWLVNKSYAKDRIMLVGASIGANIAMAMLEDEPALAGAVLLSPGNYRGIDAVELAQYVKTRQAIWTAGSDSDDTEAYEAAKAIVDTCAASRKQFVAYKNAGHGIHLFKSDPKLMDNLAAWMKESLQTI
ncbi:MAG: alpha/beta hydrolase [Patescibacteria group bacterium]